RQLIDLRKQVVVVGGVAGLGFGQRFTVRARTGDTERGRHGARDRYVFTGSESEGEAGARNRDRQVVDVEGVDLFLDVGGQFACREVFVVDNDVLRGGCADRDRERTRTGRGTRQVGGRSRGGQGRR